MEEDVPFYCILDEHTFCSAFPIDLANAAEKSVLTSYVRMERFLLFIVKGLL